MKKILIIAFTFMISLGYAQSKDFYNTNHIQKICTLGKYDIKFLKNKIIFNTEKKISTPLKYNNQLNEFNFNNTYQIKDSLNHISIFKFGWVSFSEGKTIFLDIKWVKNKPDEFTNFRTYEFSVVKIDFIQFGKISICTIGDSQTWVSHSQNLRRLMNEAYDDLLFIGSDTDIYGYGHEAEGGNGTKQVLNRIKNIPKSDYYSLLIGTNNWKDNLNETYKDIIKIVNHLTKLNPNSKILYLTPLPTTNEKRDLFNKSLMTKLLLDFKNNEHIIIIDLYEKIKKSDNWENKYLSDGLHPSLKGVKIIAELLTSKIKSSR